MLGRKLLLLKSIDKKLDLVLLRQEWFEKEVHRMSAQLDNLAAKVTKIDGVVDSAVSLIKGLSDQIKALKDDPAKLDQLASDLDAKADSLAAAVAAGSPPAPQP